MCCIVYTSFTTLRIALFLNVIYQINCWTDNTTAKIIPVLHNIINICRAMHRLIRAGFSIGPGGHCGHGSQRFKGSGAPDPGLRDPRCRRNAFWPSSVDHWSASSRPPSPLVRSFLTILCWSLVLVGRRHPPLVWTFYFLAVLCW
jgi:hypothetical protein